MQSYEFTVPTAPCASDSDVRHYIKNQKSDNFGAASFDFWRMDRIVFLLARS